MIGLGLGIIISVITFCFIPYKSISNEEIIEKSKDLGMVNPLDLSPEKFVLSEEEIIKRAKKIGMKFNLEDKVSSNKSNESGENEIVTIFIPRGLTSKEISILLYENKLIDDSNAFDLYLQKNNIDRSISDGYLDIPLKCDYKTIADILTN